MFNVYISMMMIKKAERVLGFGVMWTSEMQESRASLWSVFNLHLWLLFWIEEMMMIRDLMMVVSFCGVVFCEESLLELFVGFVWLRTELVFVHSHYYKVVVMHHALSVLKELIYWAINGLLWTFVCLHLSLPFICASFVFLYNNVFGLTC